MATLNLQSNTAQAAMNPLNTSLTSSTATPFSAGVPTFAPSTLAGAPYTPSSTFTATPNSQAVTTATGYTSPYNPAVPTQGTPAPVPLYQTPAFVPTPVGTGLVPTPASTGFVPTPVSSGLAHGTSITTPINPTMYNSPLIPVQPPPPTSIVNPAMYNASPPASTISSPENISAAFSTPESSQAGSLPGSTVTAKPSQLTTDITAGAAPLMSIVPNGEEANHLQSTPQVFAQ